MQVKENDLIKSKMNRGPLYCLTDYKNEINYFNENSHSFSHFDHIYSVQNRSLICYAKRSNLKKE